MSNRSTEKTTREMFVRTRRAWRATPQKSSPFVCIVINFTSVSGKQSTDYAVTLWLDGSQIDTCTCQGFERYGHCCHLDHFRMVEQLRAAMTSASPTPAQKAIVLEALIVSLKSTIGASLISSGTPAPARAKKTRAKKSSAIAKTRAATDALIEKVEQEQTDLDNFHYWQAELANEKDESNEEARISAMTDQALMEHATLNGNRREGVLMPKPLTQTPTPIKVSMAWLCNR